MMTSWNNTRTIERYLDGTLTWVNKIVFVSHLLVNPGLRRDLYFQKKAYRLIKMYHRKKQRDELEMLHQQIFSDPHKIDFRIQIQNLFN